MSEANVNKNRFPNKLPSMFCFIMHTIQGGLGEQEIAALVMTVSRQSLLNLKFPFTDETYRVTLKSCSDSESDYINASFINVSYFTKKTTTYANCDC